MAVIQNVEGAEAEGTVPTSFPVRVSGWDDSDMLRTLRTDANGKLEVILSTATDFTVLNAGVRDIDQGETLGARWGDPRAQQGVTAFLAGNIVGISCTLQNAVTAGDVTIRSMIGGVANNGGGQTLVINSGQNGQLDLTGAPIAFVAGDILDLELIASGAYAPDNNHATVALVLDLSQ